MTTKEMHEEVDAIYSPMLAACKHLWAVETIAGMWTMERDYIDLVGRRMPPSGIEVMN